MTTIVGHIKNDFPARMAQFSAQAVKVWLALAVRADDARAFDHGVVGQVRDRAAVPVVHAAPLAPLVGHDAGGDTDGVPRVMHAQPLALFVVGCTGNHLVDELPVILDAIEPSAYSGVFPAIPALVHGRVVLPEHVRVPGAHQ